MEGVSAAIVCTPATTHYAVTQQCLLAGKHVLIEKPITHTVDEADQLTDLAIGGGLGYSSKIFTIVPLIGYPAGTVDSVTRVS